LLRERFPRQAQIPGIRLCRIRGKWQQTLRVCAFSTVVWGLRRMRWSVACV
jgi:hypothetical protein